MTAILIYCVGILVNLLPYIALALAPFKDTFRLSRQRVILMIAAISVSQISTTLILISFYNPGKICRLVCSLIFYAIYIISYLYTVRANGTKLLFVLIIVKNYADFISTVAKYLELYFFPQDAVTSYMPYFTLFQLLLLIPTLPILWYLMAKQVAPVLKLPLKKEWSTLWLIPAMFSVFNYLITNELSTDIISRSNYIATLCVMMTGSYIVYFVVLKMLTETAKNVRLTENSRMIGQQLSLEHEHYQLLSEHIEEAKRARHDLRHHLALIQAYLDNNDNEKLKEYISQYRLAVPTEATVSLCKNYAVDIITQYYAELAQQAGITAKILLNLPSKMGIADSDLCIVFGNLLENAIEACVRQLDVSNRFLSVTAAVASGNVMITVDNSFEGNIKKDEGVFQSSKRKGYGIGVTSVQAVAERYNGFASFEYSENVFKVSVMLHQLNDN